MVSLSVACDPLDLDGIKDKIENGCRTNANGCWLWQGVLNFEDTGSLRVHGKNFRVDRVAYWVYVATIPKFYKVINTCGVPTCCNPLHMKLEPLESKIGYFRAAALTPKERKEIAVSTIGITKLKGKWELTKDQILAIRQAYRRSKEVVN